MNIAHLWAQPNPIPVHAILAFAALFLGIAQMLLPKGTIPHRVMGYLWMLLMGAVAITAAFIYDIRLWGPFSPIHLLVPYVLFSIWSGWRAARTGEVEKHRRTMRALFFLGLLVAGAFTFMPGRAMHTVLFGG